VRLSLRAADRPARGLHRVRGIRSRSLARLSGRPDARAEPRHPAPAAEQSPGPRPPPRPSAELPRPSVPEGTPELLRRSRRGLSWDIDSRTYVLSVKINRHRRRPTQNANPQPYPAIPSRSPVAIPGRYGHLPIRVARGYITGPSDRPEGAANAPSSLGPRSADSPHTTKRTSCKAAVGPRATPVGVWLECRTLPARRTKLILTGVVRSPRYAGAEMETRQLQPPRPHGSSRSTSGTRPRLR
jgi:hypothetical protein